MEASDVVVCRQWESCRFLNEFFHRIWFKESGVYLYSAFKKRAVSHHTIRSNRLEWRPAGFLKTLVMQRQIKFRAWDGKEMYLPKNADQEDFFVMPDGDVMYTTDDRKTYNSYPVTRRRENWLLMQFTGLKDKNGEEIYEGDVIHSCGGLTLYVYWDADRCGFLYKNDHGFIAAFSGGDCIDIIGNIYENSELLPHPVTQDQWTKEYQGRTGDELPEGTDTVPTTQPGNG
jgi:uncharacterized phage protein (TIGR01671 family)